jgi:hypothetical protein
MYPDFLRDFKYLFPQRFGLPHFPVVLEEDFAVTVFSRSINQIAVVKRFPGSFYRRTIFVGNGRSAGLRHKP